MHKENTARVSIEYWGAIGKANKSFSHKKMLVENGFVKFDQLVTVLYSRREVDAFCRVDACSSLTVLQSLYTSTPTNP